MFFVDTNVFVYAANKDCPEFEPCHKLIDEWRRSGTPWHSSWPVFYEFMRVVTHPRVLAKPFKLQEAWKFVGSILQSPTFKVLINTDKHEGVLDELISAHPLLGANILHDMHNVALMKENGITKIYTCDTDFHRFRFLEVINPL